MIAFASGLTLLLASFDGVLLLNSCLIDECGSDARIDLKTRNREDALYSLSSTLEVAPL